MEIPNLNFRLLVRSNRFGGTLVPESLPAQFTRITLYLPDAACHAGENSLGEFPGLVL